MSLIDWSDPEEMLGLLVEYVADESIGETDADRAAFLRELWRDLEDLSGRQFESVNGIVDAICEIRAAQPAEFLSDAVITHVDACAEELRRIGSDTTGSRAL